MKVYEFYVVKEDNFEVYEIKNKIGLGITAIEKPTPLNSTNKVKIDEDFLIPSEDMFKVYVNECELVNLVDYIVRDYNLIFLNPLMQGDKITIEDSILDNVKIVAKSSYDRNSLYKMFSSEVKFRVNHTYNYELKIKDELYTSKFVTKFDPFYTTVKKIRLDTGSLLDKATDEQISNVIYLNSKEALEKIGEVDEIENYVRNYVRYKTDMDLCYMIYLSLTGKYGSQSKKIGDIQIDKTVKLPYLSDMIGRFKELMKPNEDLMNGDNVQAASFVKAQQSEYPVSNRGVF